MNESSWNQCFAFCSGNRKSKIKNPKFRGPTLSPLLYALWFWGALLFVLCSVAEAQQTGKIYRVGYLSGSFPGSNLGINSVKRELHHLGYIEGKNIAFEYRYAQDKPERSAALADELVRLKVDVIIAGGSSDTRATKNATRTIPIVFLESVSDPVALGLVASLAHPGGNVTGFTTIATALVGSGWRYSKKRFQNYRVLPCCGIRRPGRRATMARKPTRGIKNWSATLFDEREQRRQVGNRFRRSS